MTKSSAIEWLRWIYRWKVQETESNILMLTVSVATGKRSFSKLKLIKSYMRSSMALDPLSCLSLISIEHETVEKIDFDEVCSNVASVKAQKVKIG